MSQSASASSLGSEYDAFLFASIGEESNGLSLSVVSALARLDLDPWLEAARLATLPPDAAARKLTGLFQPWAEDPLADSDRTAMATRLVALLPRKECANIRPSSELVSSRSRLALFVFATMLVLLTAQILLAQYAASARADASREASYLAEYPQRLQSGVDDFE